MADISPPCFLHYLEDALRLRRTLEVFRKGGGWRSPVLQSRRRGVGIEYEVTGSVGVTLIYGSGSDRARGDGAETSDEFPISLRFRMPVDHPHDFDMADVTSEVDTSGWFDDGDDDDGDDADGPESDVIVPPPF